MTGSMLAQSGEGALIGGFFGLFFLVWLAFIVFAVGSCIWWIVALIEVVQIPEHQYRAAGTDKTTWLLVVLLAGGLGALIWWFAKRKDVKAYASIAAPGAVAPPGWYPDPNSGQQRWWDGARWT